MFQWWSFPLLQTNFLLCLCSETNIFPTKKKKRQHFDCLHGPLYGKHYGWWSFLLNIFSACRLTDEILTSLPRQFSGVAMNENSWNFWKFSCKENHEFTTMERWDRASAISNDVALLYYRYSKLRVGGSNQEGVRWEIVSFAAAKTNYEFPEFVIRLTMKLETISLAASCCELLFSSATRLE